MPSPPTSFYGLTGGNAIDGLLGLIKWGGSVGTGIGLTYAFPDGSTSWVAGYGSDDEPNNGFQSLNTNEESVAAASLQVWANVANLTFAEVNNHNLSPFNGDIRFSIWNDSSSTTVAHAYFPSQSSVGGDVWLNSDWYRPPEDLDPGTFLNFVFMHEIGHALGFEHPEEGPIVASSQNDWMGVTVMSNRTFEGGALVSSNATRYPTTPMMNDIAAVQYVYGANTSYNSGNTTYSWSSNPSLLETIWDGGGTDTIDWSNQTSNAVIDLNEGAWSELGQSYLVGNGAPSIPESRTVAIAFGAVIENAKGGSGNDKITGNAVANKLEGLAGSDTLNGGNGSDRLIGGTGNDTLVGGASNDIFEFGQGEGDDEVQDFLSGDQLHVTDNIFASAAQALAATSYAGGNAIIDLGGGNQVTLIGIAPGSLTASAFTDFNMGDSGNNSIVGSAGADSLSGLGGNDTLVGLGGDDTLLGGSGFDLLFGDDDADSLVGGTFPDTINGGSGNDTISGGAGGDLITANGGNDSIDGGGPDTIIGGSGNDTVEGFNGNDSIVGDGGIDILYGELGNDTLYGGDDLDVLFGGGGNDVLFGQGTNDYIEGNGGNDSLVGGDSNDTLKGGNGNDTVEGNSGNDTIEGNAGDDSLVGATGADVLVGDTGNDTLSGGAAADILVGMGQHDSIDGGGGNDLIFLGYGTDTASGGNGNDSIWGLNGTDSIDGNAGIDILRGEQGNDTLNGGTNLDVLFGGTQNDVLNGGSGMDFLFGENGNDTLTGNGGADHFIFDGADGSDTITDFANGTDFIEIPSAFTFASVTEQQVGSDVVLSFGSTTITVLNTSTTEINAGDFLFF